MESPFKLFEPYRPEDKDIFFGRDGEISALYNLLKQTRLVLVYGASGTGKTSLIQAGLPKVFKVTDWYRVSIRRGDDINRSVEAELRRNLEEETGDGNVPGMIGAIFSRRRIPIYLVFDQFEELFTLGHHHERRAFFQILREILDADLPCTVILSMREEYIGHLYDYEPQVPRLFQKRFRVEPMNDATSLGVIQEMCDNYGISMERDLEEEEEGKPSTAREILGQVKEEEKKPVHLPYLQIYLHYLYGEAMTRGKRERFTHDAIKAVGKLGNVLKQYIDTQLDGAQEHLKTPGAGEGFAQKLLDEFATDEGTKQAKRPAELAKTLKADEALVRKALIYFSDTAKLLRADENDVERYEPVHDVVALQIHELRTTEAKEFKTFVRQLQLAYERWDREGRNNDRLLAQRDVDRVNFYRDKLEERDEYREQWEGYIEKSKTHWKKISRRNRMVFIGVSVVAVIAIVSAIVASIFYAQTQRTLEDLQKETAAKQAAEAQKARVEAADLVRQAQTYRDAEVDWLAKDLLQKALQLDSTNTDAQTLLQELGQ
jgi:cell division protein FtsL